AGLGSSVGRPARSRRSLVAAGLAAVMVFGLALAPSRVPFRSSRGDEVAAVSPVPTAGDGAPVQTGVPSETGGRGGGGAAAAGRGTASAATGRAGGPASAAAGATASTATGTGRAANAVTAGPGTGSGRRPAATGPTTPGPGSRTATSAAGAP